MKIIKGFNRKPYKVKDIKKHFQYMNCKKPENLKKGSLIDQHSKKCKLKQ